MVILGVKFKQSANIIIEEISNCENVDTAAIQEILLKQPEDLSEGELIHINEESGCDEEVKMFLKKGCRNSHIVMTFKVQRRKH